MTDESSSCSEWFVGRAAANRKTGCFWGVFCFVSHGVRKWIFKSHPYFKYGLIFLWFANFQVIAWIIVGVMSGYILAISPVENSIGIFLIQNAVKKMVFKYGAFIGSMP